MVPQRWLYTWIFFPDGAAWHWGQNGTRLSTTFLNPWTPSWPHWIKLVSSPHPQNKDIYIKSSPSDILSYRLSLIAPLPHSSSLIFLPYPFPKGLSDSRTPGFGPKSLLLLFTHLPFCLASPLLSSHLSFFPSIHPVVLVSWEFYLQSRYLSQILKPIPCRCLELIPN